MHWVKFLILGFSFTCIATAKSFAQINPAGSSYVPVTYVGSTPCDSLIRTLLLIPPAAACEYIKWNLSLNSDNVDSGRFQLLVSYGEYLPNTMFFKGGGTKITIPGKYTISVGANANPSAKVFQLKGNEHSQVFSLVAMDNNILHFIDGNNNLIVGNAQFGYVLNRSDQKN